MFAAQFSLRSFTEGNQTFHLPLFGQTFVFCSENLEENILCQTLFCYSPSCRFSSKVIVILKKYSFAALMIFTKLPKQ